VISFVDYLPEGGGKGPKYIGGLPHVCILMYQSWGSWWYACGNCMQSCVSSVPRPPGLSSVRQAIRQISLCKGRIEQTMNLSIVGEA